MLSPKCYQVNGPFSYTVSIFAVMIYQWNQTTIRLHVLGVLCMEI